MVILVKGWLQSEACSVPRECVHEELEQSAIAKREGDVGEIRADRDAGLKAVDKRRSKTV